jgi:2',3'-cyclic-nucleotide 2'-phosphodiesterase (5'-nucleotidase family)
VRETGRHVLLLDGGDAFGNPDAIHSLDDMLMAEYLFKGMDLCGYDLMALGEEDFRFGETFLTERIAESGFATTSANIVNQEDGLLYSAPFFKKTLGAVEVGVIGVLAEEERGVLEDTSSIHGAGVTLEPIADSIAAAKAEMGEVDLLVVMTNMPTAEARQLAEELTDADLVLATEDRHTPIADQIGNSVFATTGYDGKWVAKVGLVLDADMNLTDAHFDAVSLDDTWPDDPELVALYEEYLERLASAAEEIVEDIPQETPEGGAYIGNTQCQACHPTQHAFWGNTEHAHAFWSLQQTNHDYAPSCFPCHTTGFGFVGGFLLPSLTPSMSNVQCEECHGAGQDHMAAPAVGWSPSAVTQCGKCHTPEHSPQFDLGSYLPQVQCPPDP